MIVIAAPSNLGLRPGHEPGTWRAPAALFAAGLLEAVHALGPAGMLARSLGVLDAAPGRRFWIHLDVGVLDRSVMPAVDSPGSPGIAPDALVAVLAPLVPDPRCAGITVTVFDPGLDPDGRHAATLVRLLGRLPWPQGPCRAP